MAPALEVVEDVVEAPGTASDPVVTESPAPAEAQQTADDQLTPDAETAPPSEERQRGPDGKFIGTEGEPGQESAPETEPTLEDYPSFTYRAAGQDLEFRGAVRDDDGNVLFTPEAVQQLQQKLAYAEAYPIRDAEAQRDMLREKSRADAAEATALHLTSTLTKMFQSSQGATTWEEFAQTDLGKWILDRYTKWPELQAESIQKGADLRNKTLEQEINQYRSQQYEAQVRPQMVDQVENAVRHWSKEAGFSEAEQRRLIKKYTTDQALNAIFPRVDRDDPVTGLRAGQRNTNLDVIRLDMLEMYELLKGRTTAPRAETVAAENARRTGQAGQKAPPTPGVGRGSKPVAEKTKQYKSTREADQDIWS